MGLDRADEAEFSAGPVFLASSLRLDLPPPCVYVSLCIPGKRVHTRTVQGGREKKIDPLGRGVPRRVGRVQDRRAVSALARLSRVGDTKV